MQQLVKQQAQIDAQEFIQQFQFIQKEKSDQLREDIYLCFSKIFNVSLAESKRHLQQFTTNQQIQQQPKLDYQFVSVFMKILFGLNIMFILSLISILIDKDVERIDLTIQPNAIRLYYSITIVWIMFKFMVFVCTKQKINYQFILEIPSSNIQYSLQMLDIYLSIYTMVVTILTLLSIGSTFQSDIEWPLPFGHLIQEVNILQKSAQWLSYITIILSGILLIQTILSLIGLNKMFIHIQTVLYKVFTPWKHSVGFPLFYTADCLTSCNTLLKDLMKVIIDQPQDYVLMIIEMIPQIIRFIQCLRKYYDERLAYPHILNAGKYLSGIIVAINNLNIINQKISLKIIFIILKLIEQSYKLYYDIWQDFALLSGGTGAEQFKQQQQKWKYGKLCRRPTMLSKSFLISSIVFDILVRSTFVINYIDSINDNIAISFLLCYFEIIRRFVWSILRIDNQMATNCENYLTCKIVPILQSNTADNPLNLNQIDLQTSRSQLQTQPQITIENM